MSIPFILYQSKKKMAASLLLVAVITVFCLPIANADSEQVTAAPIASVPFHYFNHKIIFDATVDGYGPYEFGLDSGSETVIVSKQVAQAAKLPITSGNVEVSGTIGNYIPVGMAHVARLTIGTAELAEPVCTVAAGAMSLDGYIGAPLFNNYIVQIDFGHHLINLYSPGAYKLDTADVTMPVVFGKHRVPVVQGCIGTLPARFEVDTGSAFTAELLPDYIKANDLANKFTKIGSVTTSSVSGPSADDVYDLKTLNLGADNPININGVVDTVFLPISVNNADFDGRIGAPTLSQLVITFDYGKSLIAVRHIPPPDGISL